MTPDCGFHPEALCEYAEATHYYLETASARVADQFVACIEDAITDITAAPTRWRVMQESGIRRFVCDRFPFVIHYLWEEKSGFVTIFQ